MFNILVFGSTYNFICVQQAFCIQYTLVSVLQCDCFGSTFLLLFQEHIFQKEHIFEKLLLLYCYQRNLFSLGFFFIRVIFWSSSYVKASRITTVFLQSRLLQMPQLRCLGEATKDFCPPKKGKMRDRLHRRKIDQRSSITWVQFECELFYLAATYQV